MAIAIQSYEAAGNIFTSDGKPVINATVQLVYIPTGAAVGDPTTLQDPYYSAWTDEEPDKYGVKFTVPGYKVRTVSIADLIKHPDVILQSAGSIPAWMILAVLSAVVVIRKRSARIGAFGTGDVMTIFLLVGGIISFKLIQQILQSLGIWDSQDTKNLDLAASDPNSFWNPNYWQTIKPASASWSYAFTESQARDLCEQIIDAMGIFNDSEDKVFAVFKQCRTKANASFLSWVFQKEYGQDLLAYLRGSNIWPADHLSDAEVSTIDKYLSKLPKY